MIKEKIIELLKKRGIEIDAESICLFEEHKSFFEVSYDGYFIVHKEILKDD